MSVDGHLLTVVIDLRQRHGLSSTKKSVIVASTEGNAPVPGHPDIAIGVNAYVPKTPTR